MIYAEISVREIFYGKCFETLFPIAIEKCKKLENPNLAVRFLLKMGNTSMKAALGILGMLDKQDKEELLCGFANLYSLEMQSALNELLQKDELGKYFTIGDIYMDRDSSGKLVFTGRNIKIDYAGLMANDTVRQKIGGYVNQAVGKSVFGGFGLLQRLASDGVGLAAGIAAGAAPDMMEKGILSFVNKTENRERLLQMAEQALGERGIWLKLDSFVLVQEEGPDLQEGMDSDAVRENVLPERKFDFSPELEEGLLDAVAGYLKMLVEDSRA